MMYDEIGAQPNVQVGPKPILTIMSWFNPDLKPALEVFYQFDRPFVVDHSKYARAFGAQPTPHREAIRATLASLEHRNADGSG